MLRRNFLAVSAAGMAMAASERGFGQGSASTAAGRTGYVPVNGFKVYYEDHGAGDALVLLHGGLLTIELSSKLSKVTKCAT